MNLCPPKDSRVPNYLRADWFESYCERLLTMLKMRVECTCELERNAAGVPTWHKAKDGEGIERKLIHRCTRCEIIQEYEELKT